MYLVSYYLTLCILDRILRGCHLRGAYYVLQALHHMFLSILTVSIVYQSIHNVYTLAPHSYSLDALFLSTAFHLYHLTIYYPIFQLDDILYFIERCILSLSIGLYLHSPCLIGYNFFFLSTPFGFDYLSLFLYENYMCSWEQVIEVNSWLNKWIRMPLCQLHHMITVAYLYRQTERFSEQWWTGITSMVILYVHPSYFAYHSKKHIPTITKLE